MLSWSIFTSTFDQPSVTFKIFTISIKFYNDSYRELIDLSDFLSRIFIFIYIVKMFRVIISIIV